MKGSIGNIWLVGIVITFIFIFSAYITVTMNYSKAFKFKNEILTIIEKKKGITYISGRESKPSKIRSGNTVYIPKSALGTINVFLAGSGYSTMGKCPYETGGISGSGKETWYGVYELTDGTTSYKVDEITLANRDKKYYYCFSKKGRDANHVGRYDSTCDDIKQIPYYYDVVLFYKLEFPILGDLFTMRVDGTTADIYKIAPAGSSKNKCNYV